MLGNDGGGFLTGANKSSPGLFHRTNIAPILCVICASTCGIQIVRQMTGSTEFDRRCTSAIWNVL